jgi:hypothetical protein
MTDRNTLTYNVAEIDIYRAAKLMIEYYGNEAAIHAALRADYFYKDGDMEGFKTWKRIVDAIKVMQNTEAPNILN